MRGFRDGTALGKCYFCRIKIEEGSFKFRDAEARIVNMNWLCGDCLLGLKEVVDETHAKYMGNYFTAQNEMAKAAGMEVDPKTGKLITRN